MLHTLQLREGFNIKPDIYFYIIFSVSGQIEAIP